MMQSRKIIITAISVTAAVILIFLIPKSHSDRMPVPYQDAPVANAVYESFTGLIPAATPMDSGVSESKPSGTVPSGQIQAEDTQLESEPSDDEEVGESEEENIPPENIPPDAETTSFPIAQTTLSFPEASTTKAEENNDIMTDIAFPSEITPLSETTTQNPNPRRELTSEDIEIYKNEVIKYTNEARANAGLSQLGVDPLLMRTAQIRADECASIKNIRYNDQPHVRPDGTKWYTVFMITTNSNYGENAGMGCFNGKFMTNVWMNSEGHRANILRPTYTLMGVGCAVDTDGMVYCIQHFYQP
ncbi:MAG: CAP domain-containing protein [Clostridiales bacterium]|nr:CAP domain-containing protein [Clostridiales bacterium]